MESGVFICTRFASLTLQRREDAANGKPAYQPAYIRYAQANHERGEALCFGNPEVITTTGKSLRITQIPFNYSGFEGYT